MVWKFVFYSWVCRKELNAKLSYRVWRTPVIFSFNNLLIRRFRRWPVWTNVCRQFITNRSASPVFRVPSTVSRLFVCFLISDDDKFLSIFLQVFFCILRKVSNFWATFRRRVSTLLCLFIEGEIKTFLFVIFINDDDRRRVVRKL